MFGWFKRKRKVQISPKVPSVDPTANATSGTSQQSKENVAGDVSKRILLDGLQDSERRLAEKVLEDASAGAIELPTLPDLAVALRKAVNDPDVSVEQVAQMMQADMVVGSKLVQVANSAMYGGYTQTSTLLQAITRLGLFQTRDIVTSLTMKQLFKSGRPEIEARVKDLWNQSVKVAAISAVLARITRAVDPERALLAGLTHVIGALAVINYIAREPADTYTDGEVDAAIGCLRGLVGNIVLKHWNFDQGLAQVPMSITDMLEPIPGPMSYTDLVRIAKLHAVAGSPAESQYPPLTEVPSFNKFAKLLSGPEASINALREARSDIEAVRNTLGM